MTTTQAVPKVDELHFNDQQVAHICRLLAAQTGFTSCEAYKSSCLQRRILARMQRSGCRTPDHYVDLLFQDQQEVHRLARMLTIHVSQFFRNPMMFERLRHELLPKLFRKTVAAGEPLKIWSVGCAGGEEPYSLAILLAESFAEQLAAGMVELLATDIDEKSLQTAQQGVFEAGALKEVSAPRRDRWFTQSAQGVFQLRPELVQIVAFRKMDLMAFDLFEPSHLVLCRNTLIYFHRQAQEKILQALGDNLLTGGILVLGKSETLPGTLRRRYVPISPEERIYQRV